MIQIVDLLNYDAQVRPTPPLENLIDPLPGRDRLAVDCQLNKERTKFNLASICDHQSGIGGSAMSLIESSDAPAWAGMAEALAGVGYWRMETATKRIQWSLNMFSIFGFEPEAAPSLEAAMARVHPDDRFDADENLSHDVLGNSSRKNSAVRIIWPSGEVRHIEGNTHPVRDTNGAVVAVVGAVLDVSDRVRTEAALLQAKEQAERTLADKSAFVANVTHELRTPLTAIIGFSELLEEGKAPDQRRLGLLKSAGKTLLSIVNNILDYSRIQEGRALIVPVACSPEEICRECLDLFQALADERGLELRFSAAQLPPFVLVDPDALRQLLVNLIGNAIKYTTKGWIRISISHVEGNLKIVVRDSGSGIHPGEIDHLFERYTRGSIQPSGVGGAGLGLSICKAIAEAMGGSIAVTSDPGRGARFAFSTPAPVVHSPQIEALFDLSWASILIADDNDAVREISRCILEAAGAKVTEARDGLTAIACASSERYDVLLIDLNMPGITGVDVVKHLRSLGINRSAPIYAFTASGSATPASVQADGFDGLFLKPIDPKKLLSLIHAARIFRAA